MNDCNYNEPRENEIESIVEHQLTQIEQQITLMKKQLKASRSQKNDRAWITMINDFKNLQSIHVKLEMLNISLRCAVEKTNPHEGADG